MKSKLFAVIILLTVLNVYSQPKQLFEIENHLKFLSYENETKIDNYLSENDILAKHLKKTFLTKNFDSATVIDSVILVEYGDKYKYTYSYDSDGNRILFLYELWRGGEWENNYRFTYTYSIKN